MRWLYAPGAISYLPHLAKYSNSVKTVKGIQVLPITHKQCCNTIGERYHCVKFAEIIDFDSSTSIIAAVTDNSSNSSSSSSHSTLLSLLTAMFWYILCMLKDYLQGISNTGCNYSIKFNRFCLGQEADIAAVNREYRSLPLSDEPTIAYGVSRGAAALVNWLAGCQPASDAGGSNTRTSSTRGIKALVLEGCPSSVDDILNHSCGLQRVCFNVVRPLLGYITSYRPDGPHPIDNVTKLPYDIPILFITSKSDTAVPYQSSVNMYHKMTAAGYTNVHLCLLQSATHDNYMTGTEADRQTYIEAVNSIYKLVLQKQRRRSKIFDC